MSTIQYITNTVYKYSNRAIDKVVNKLPNIAVSNKTLLKGIKWTGEHISSPQNRLILGISALMSQPFIDLHNKRVDEETRKSSAARTVAKIIAGTTSGFFVRYYAIKAVEKMTNMPAKNLKAWQTFFTPPPSLVKLSQKMLSKYKNAIGTLLALGIMLCTNFLFDAPVTKVLTNKFIAYNKNQADKKRAKYTPPPVHIPFPIIYTPHKSSTNLIDKAVNTFAGKEVHHG